MTFNPEELSTLECILAIRTYMKSMSDCQSMNISHSAQLHAITVNFVQAVIHAKDLDKLFSEEPITRQEIDLLHALTTKLVSICEDYISDALESQ